MLALNPKTNDKLIGHPQGRYDLPFTVIEVCLDGVRVVTDKNKVIMKIPIAQWDAYVKNKTITESL